ncbi:hypothetical protein [Mycoplasma sp. Z1473D]
MKSINLNQEIANVKEIFKSLGISQYEELPIDKHRYKCNDNFYLKSQYAVKIPNKDAILCFDFLDEIYNIDKNNKYIQVISKGKRKYEFKNFSIWFEEIKSLVYPTKIYWIFVNKTINNPNINYSLFPNNICLFPTDKLDERINSYFKWLINFK